MITRSLTKDPGSELDWAVDWSVWMEGETIVAAEFTADPSLTITRTIYTTTHAIVWLVGGVLRTKPKVTCRIETTSGRKPVASFRLLIKENAIG